MILSLLFAFTLACGTASDPPPITVSLTSDGSHACAGAVRVKVELAELNGDTTEKEFAAAVPPEQLDCDFDAGVGEALYAALVGEIETGVPYTVRVLLLDSTGFTVAAGSSEPFEAHAADSKDAIAVEVTRAAPVGTVLLDLMAEPSFANATGTLDFVILAGNDPIGSRHADWPGTAAGKRPLRISGLLGIGLRVIVDLTAADGTVLVSMITGSFFVGSDPADAFASPVLEEKP